MNNISLIGLVLVLALIAGGFVIFQNDLSVSSEIAGITPTSQTGESTNDERSSAEKDSPVATKRTPFVEIVNPSGFVNTNDQPFRIADYVGKQVILLNVMTYSCINCQRTFPYVNSWYEEYKDDGLIVIGIHTPEFAFEKDKANVEAEFKKFGITYPTVLDNEYATWRALGNRFWPRKYLIDINGNIVYDHVGEGAYEETEEKIKELLQERARILGADDRGSAAL